MILRNPYFSLILIGMISRIFWSLFVSFEPIVAGDALFYMDMATNLREFGVYGDGLTKEFYRAPLYSFFLALISFIPGSLEINTIIVQNFVSVIVTIFCYSLLVNWRPILAFVWAAAWLSSPFAALNDFLILQESLYTNLIMLAAVVAFSALPSFNLRSAFVIGILLGASAYVRDVYLLLPFAFIVAILWSTAFAAWKNLIFTLFVFIFSVTPWMVRNTSIDGGGFFMSKGIAGMSLYVGTWLRDDYWEKPWLSGRNMPDQAFEANEDRSAIEAAMRVRDDDFLKETAINRIKDRPIEIVGIWIGRARTMWLGTRSDLSYLKLQSGSNLWIAFKSTLWGLNTIILIFGLLGLFQYGLRKSPLLIFSGVILYVYSIYLPFLNIETRYSMPALVWLYLFAILFVDGFIKNLRKWSHKLLS